MTGPRILYVNEDYGLPSGGVRAIYRHVEVMRRHGYEAFVAHQSAGFRLDWFESAEPVLFLDNISAVGPRDIVVLPETLDERRFPQLAGGRTVLNCRNHYYIFRGLAERRMGDRRFEAILCCSAAIRRFVESLGMDVPTHTIPCGIDLAKYRPGSKIRQIALMPRKRPKDAEFIMRCFREIYPEYGDVAWRALTNASEREVAEVLGQSAAFLSLAHTEGFGRPALEAMAAGCVITGFHGGGGEEYATTGNGFWCEDWDLIGCADRLGQALALADAAPNNRLVRNGRQTAARYALEVEEDAIVKFWRGFLP